MKMEKTQKYLSRRFLPGREWSTTTSFMKCLKIALTLITFENCELYNFLHVKFMFLTQYVVVLSPFKLYSFIRLSAFSAQPCD